MPVGPALGHHQDAVGERSSSGSSELTSTIARPRPAQPLDQVVDLLLGADVDAAGRLVEEQHARRGGQPLADHDLLLVAAGERRRPAARAGAADPELPTAFRASAVSPRAMRQPNRASAASEGSATLSRIGKSRMQARALAVLGDEAIPSGWRRAGRRSSTGAPSTPISPAARRRRRRRASPGSRCGPEPSSPPMPEHLAGAHVEARRRRATAPAAPARHLEREGSTSSTGRRPRAAPGAGRRLGAARGRPWPLMISARLISAIGAVHQRPSRSTVTRSARAITSSSRCEM